MLKSIDEFQMPINEKESFIDWLTGKKEEGDPKQAEQGELSGIGETDVDQFYNDLQDFVHSGKSISVQVLGNMQYSKLVEEIQSALVFLGYPLPKFGIDGLFGPETATAISKFNGSITNEGLLSFGDFINQIYESANGRMLPSELKVIASTGASSSGHKLNPIAANAYDEMTAAAKIDGISWAIIDSYRAYDAQVKVAQDKGLYKNGGYAAIPGTSNHGTGSAVDLKLGQPAQAWLQANASKYGFSTIPNEPWHWEHKASKHSSGNTVNQANTILIDSSFASSLIKALKDKNFSQDDLSKLMRKEGETLTSEEDSEFYKTILKGLGANETPEKIKFLKAWRQAEGGKAANNPFNTTKKVNVSGVSNYNSVGVKNYPDRQTGLNATIGTIKLPYYRRLWAMLRDDTITAAELAQCPDLHTWGTGDNAERVLATNRLNPPPIYSTAA